MLEPEETLDPQNWDEMRALGHRMVDDMLTYLQTVRERPVWQHAPPQVKEAYRFAAAMYEDPGPTGSGPSSCGVDTWGGSSPSWRRSPARPRLTRSAMTSGWLSRFHSVRSVVPPPTSIRREAGPRSP